MSNWWLAWSEIIPFCPVPLEVRRLVYITNAIEALNAKLRRTVRVRARGHFPTDEAALKLLFLVLNRRKKDWTRPPLVSCAWPEPNCHPVWRAVQQSDSLILGAVQPYTENSDIPTTDEEDHGWVCEHPLCYWRLQAVGSEDGHQLAKAIREEEPCGRNSAPPRSEHSMPPGSSEKRGGSVKPPSRVPPACTIGRQRIMTGDCLVRLLDLPDATFNLIVTSPPYNIGVGYMTYHDRRPRREYLDWLSAVGAELKRVLTDDGSFFLNIGSTNADPWIPIEVASAFRGLFKLQNQIIWVKSIAIEENTLGHFKPTNSQRYLNHSHEAVFHFTKTGKVTIDRLAAGVPFKDKTNIARWGHRQDKRCAGNVWFIPYRTVQSRSEKFYHPAGFPIELPKRCIQLHGRLDGHLLDPFLGTGTTLVAAEECGMNGTGIELDEQYVKIARRRLKELHSASLAKGQY